MQGGFGTFGGGVANDPFAMFDQFFGGLNHVDSNMFSNNFGS